VHFHAPSIDKGVTALIWAIVLGGYLYVFLVATGSNSAFSFVISAVSGRTAGVEHEGAEPSGSGGEALPAGRAGAAQREDELVRELGSDRGLEPVAGARRVRIEARAVRDQERGAPPAG